MPRSLRSQDHIVHREAGHALEGDQILIECRKPGKWQTVRASQSHHYFATVITKNAYAVPVRAFTNVRVQIVVIPRVGAERHKPENLG
ncbi:MAG: hypothetical protein AB1641_30605 [Thermodesulfobacteriota bacterium]